MAVSVTKIEFRSNKINEDDPATPRHLVRDPARSHMFHASVYETYVRKQLAVFHCVIASTEPGIDPIEITVPVPWHGSLVEAGRLAKLSLIHTCHHLISDEADFGALDS